MIWMENCSLLNNHSSVILCFLLSNNGGSKVWGQRPLLIAHFGGQYCWNCWPSLFKLKDIFPPNETYIYLSIFPCWTISPFFQSNRSLGTLPYMDGTTNWYPKKCHKQYETRHGNQICHWITYIYGYVVLYKQLYILIFIHFYLHLH